MTLMLDVFIFVLIVCQNNILLTFYRHDLCWNNIDTLTHYVQYGQEYYLEKGQKINILNLYKLFYFLKSTITEFSFKEISIFSALSPTAVQSICAVDGW